MIKCSTSQKGGSRALQQRLDQCIERAAYLNIKFAVKKAEIMHIIPHTSGRRHNEDRVGISLYDQQISTTEGIKSLGVWIDRRLSFKKHAAMAAVNTRRTAGFLWCIVKRKGVTPGAIHHLAMTTSVPTMLWESEAWWTGAQHILGQLGPA